MKIIFLFVLLFLFFSFGLGFLNKGPFRMSQMHPEGCKGIGEACETNSECCTAYCDQNKC